MSLKYEIVVGPVDDWAAVLELLEKVFESVAPWNAVFVRVLEE